MNNLITIFNFLRRALNMGPSGLQILTAGYSMHQKPFHTANANGLGHYLIRLQSLGKCRSKLNNELELLEPGDLLLFAPDDPYELKIAAEQQTRDNHSVYSADYHIFVQGTWVQEWWNERNRPHKIKVPLSEGIIGSFRQIMTELRRIPNNTPQIMEYYFKILCMDIDRHYTEYPIPTYKSYIASRIKNYIEENASNPFKLEDAAAHVGISVSHAVHLFKEAYDTSIIQYTLEIRLNMARERIMFSPLSLEHVAESSGFPSYNYFHKVFRNRYGMSPKQFRQSTMHQE